jgi:hypothetical protein
MIPLKVETVIECLNHDSNEWDALASQYSSKEDVSLERLSNDKIIEIYNHFIIKATKPVNFE